MSNKKDNIDKGENFSTITIYNDTEYYRIAYVENTLLFGKTSMANKVSLDGLFEKAGY
jgi:cytolysin (calcineurin-like family phosphatase)